MRKIIYLLTVLAFSAISLRAYAPENKVNSALPVEIQKENATPILAESAGWITKGRYKELKAHTKGVASIRVTKDGKRLISVSGNEYKIWDAETGNQLHAYTIPNKGFDTLIILDDKSIVALGLTYKEGDFFTSYSVEARLYNIENDSITYQFTPFNESFNATPSYVNKVDIEAKFDNSSRNLYLSVIIRIEDKSNTQGRANYVGGIKKADLSGNSVVMSKVGNVLISNFLFTKNDDIAAISETYSATCKYNRDVVFLYYVSSLIISDKEIIDTLEIHNGISQGYFNSTHIKTPLITNLKLLPSKNILVECLEDSIFYFRDMDDYSINDSCKLSARTSSYEFSYNQNFLITGYKNGIYIFSAPQLIPVDSFYYNYPINGWKIAVFPDSVTFATGSSDGYIRLFRSEALRGGPISAKDPVENTISPIVFPNPAEDNIFLLKNDALLGSAIEIYSPTGIKVLEAPYAERIDVSELPAGMYFIRVGGKYGKFVKK